MEQMAMSVSTQTNSDVPSIPLYKLKEIHDLTEIKGQNRKIFIELTEDEIYPSQHQDEMGETDFHYNFTSYLRNSLKLFFEQRADVFVAANMSLYYEKDDPQKWTAPDVFVAFGVNSDARRTYKLWQENVFPQVIFEVASETTWRNDISEKHAFYEQHGVEEYYLIDTENFLPVPLIAFQSEKGKLNRLMLAENRVLSPQLKLEIVHTKAEIKLFNPDKQEFLRSLSEAEKEIEQLRTEISKLKGEN